MEQGFLRKVNDSLISGLSLHKAARTDLTSMISRTKVGPAVLEQNNTGLAEDQGDENDGIATARAQYLRLGVHHEIHQPKLADDFAQFDNHDAPPYDLNKKQG